MTDTVYDHNWLILFKPNTDNKAFFIYIHPSGYF